MSLSSIYLDAFYACARVGNFTRAADRLHITQSALSQRIKNLEDELSTSLFVRDRAGIRLTEDGHQLLRYCQAKESIEAEAVASIQRKDSLGLQGFVRIGGFSSVMRSVILPALAPLIGKNPGLRVSLVTRELGERPVLLKRGEIDYMIVTQVLQRDDLEVETLGTERNVLVQKKNSDAPDIFLDHDEEDSATQDYLRLFKMKTKVERRYFDDVYGIVDAARFGLGKAVVPIHLIRDDKKLSVINKDKVLSVPVVLHFYKQDYYSKTHQAVVETLKVNGPKFL